MEKQKRQNKKIGFVSTPCGRGLNFVNFPTVIKSLRLAWISRFLSNSRDSWKAIPNHFLSTHGGLQFLLKCNYYADSINNNLPTFYRELLQYFQEFKNNIKLFSYGNFLLLNNEAITIEEKMLFWKSWFDRKSLLYSRYLKR